LFGCCVFTATVDLGLAVARPRVIERRQDVLFIDGVFVSFDAPLRKVRLPTRYLVVFDILGKRRLVAFNRRGRLEYVWRKT